MPPGATFRVAGALDRAGAVAGALRRGGLRAKVTAKAGSGEMAAARNMPHFVALEHAGWSLERLSEYVGTSSRAARQATEIVAAVYGVKRPSRMSTSPGSARRTLRLLARLAPFDFETYARTHSAKIGTQTAEMIRSWIEEGQARAMPVDALTAFRQGPKLTTMHEPT